MPGAGKSTVGRLLAARLGFPFADTDELVVAQAGRPIADLFASEGDEAFRVRELQAVRRLLASAPVVISTGGGAMTYPPMREILLARTLTIWLQATSDTLVQRLTAAPPRPLLAGKGLAERLRTMAAEREASYAQARLSLVTDHLTPEEAADTLASLLSPRALR